LELQTEETASSIGHAADVCPAGFPSQRYATRETSDKPDLIHRAARFFARRTFSFWEKLGLHLTYVHYYEPVPDTRSLGDAVWNPNLELPGIDMNDRFQTEFLRQLGVLYGTAWEALVRSGVSRTTEFLLGNGYFDSVDAEILYGIVRRFKPRRIFEIGSGFSTLLIENAIRDNRGEDSSYACEHVAIDPFPADFLSRGGRGLAVLPKRVQDVPLSTFQNLERNDVLFIDSSHVLAIGSDVRFEYLEILPRLNPGVLIHCHDIFIPAEYPRDWIFRHRRFWNEQYLLQAFLAFNPEFEILWAGNYMHLKHSGLLAQSIPSYRQGEVQPKSFWIRRKG
jgi:predicted O-methyltransferase YrrM